MPYQDMKISGFQITPSQKQVLYKSRYNSDAAIRLNFRLNNGYDAFIMLNPDLTAIMSSIYRIDKQLTVLSAKIPYTAMDQFISVSMVEEIQQSNEIENVESTRKEIRDALDAVNKGIHGKRFESMVRKYKLLQSEEAIPLSSCQDIRKLYDGFVLDEVIREDAEDAPDGVIFRNSPVHVTDPHGENIHDGLFPESVIISAMDSTLSILHNDTMDILIRVALFHYFFGYIHPFYNGNGRMVRFISSYMLSRQLSNSACLRISYVIKEHRKKYYELFRNANDKRNMGELTEFVMGYLSFVMKAEEETLHILEEKHLLYQDYRARLETWINSHLGHLSSSQKMTFEHMLQIDLFGIPFFDINIIAELMECSTRTARKILSDAAEIVTYAKKGNKQIWHINLNALAPG